MNTKRTATLFASLALAATGTTFFASTAVAVAPPVVVSADANVANINPSGTYNLNITKYLGAPVSQTPADGTAQTGINLPTLQGVKFDVYQVYKAGSSTEPIDLTTNAGYEAASKLQGYVITPTDISRGYLVVGGQQYQIKLASTVTTNASGVANFSSTPGLFLVNENLATSTNILNGSTPVPASSVTPSKPFLVTLPMTTPAGDAWMNTVYAYPKNQSDSISKSVSDQGTVSTAMGSNLTSSADTTLDYTLTGTITPGLTGSQMGTYVFVDQMPTGATFTGVSSVKAGTTTLTAGTDYKVYVNGTEFTGGTAPAGALVQISMTPAGLDKLAAAKAGDPNAKVVAVLTAKITGANGSFGNTAYIIPSNAWWQGATNNPTATYDPTSDTPTSDTPAGGGTSTPVNTTNPSPTIQAKYGSASITKTDAANGDKLANAKFSLYSATSTAATASASDCSTVTTSGSPIMTNLTTDANGKLVINGLQQSDFYDGKTQTTNFTTYCLVETQAPSGYNLLAQPVAFRIGDTTTALAVSVKNEKRNLANALPLTGGAGAASLGLLGLGVAGAGVWYAMRRREDDLELDGEI